MDEMDRIQIPAVSRLFRGMTQEEARSVLTRLGARACTYAKGETIIRPWTPITDFYLVFSGEVHSFCRYADGERSVNGAFGPGDVFGIVFAFSDLGGNPSAAVAVTDSVIVRIPIVDIVGNTVLSGDETGRQYIQNAVNIIAHTAYLARLRSFVVSRKTLRDRIMAYLIEKSRRFGCGEFDIPFDRQELADFLCVNRCSLCSELADMRRNGLIDCKGRHFRILEIKRPTTRR